MYTSKNTSLNIKKKLKSKCAECLTDRTFFNKINDDYDLKQLIFFLTHVFYKRT